MRAASPQRIAEPDDIFHRRLLLQKLPLPESKPRLAARQHSPALQVLVEGFLHGSLLTLAVRTPKRGSLLNRETATRREPLRTFLVSRPTAPTFEEPAREAMPVAR
jgi:hypothetical protein